MELTCLKYNMYQAFALVSEHYKQSKDGLSMVIKQGKKDFGET